MFGGAWQAGDDAWRGDLEHVTQPLYHDYSWPTAHEGSVNLGRNAEVQCLDFAERFSEQRCRFP